jgi:hypothetical protein
MNEQANEDLDSQPKVTIGFKAPVWLKSKLAEKSGSLGITISEFCEMHFLKNLNSDNTADSENQYFIKAQMETIENKLAFYENPKMKGFLSRLNGKDFQFTDFDGNLVEVHVKTIQDVFTLMIKSFKIDDSLC